MARRHRLAAAALVLACLLPATIAPTIAGAAAKPKAVPAAQWVHSMCGSVDAWNADVSARVGTANRAVPAEWTAAQARDAMAATLAAVADRTDELVAVLTIEGVPKGKGGAASAQAMVDTYQVVAEDLRDARKQLTGAGDNPDALTTAVDGAAASLIKAVTASGETDGLPSGRTPLARLVKADATCQLVAQR